MRTHDSWWHNLSGIPGPSDPPAPEEGLSCPNLSQKTGGPRSPGRMLTVENVLLESHNTSQMLLGSKATSGPEGFPSPPGVLKESAASLAPRAALQAPRASGRAFSVWRLPGTALQRSPAYTVDSSCEGPMVGSWGPGLAVAARAAESLEVAGESLRGLRIVTVASEGLGPIVERAEALRRMVAGREGCLDAVWAPEAEDEGSGVTGGGPGAPGEAGGREEAPGGIEGPGEGQEGWEAPGSPGNMPPGPKGGEGKAWAPEGLTGIVCMSDRFVLRRSWRSCSAGLRGDTAGGPGQELQLSRASGSPRGIRATLLSSTSPRGERPRLSSRESREGAGQEDAQWFSPTTEAGLG